MQLLTPYTLLPNVTSHLIWDAGWLGFGKKHQDQGLCSIFSLTKGIQRLEHFSHLLILQCMVQDPLLRGWKLEGSRMQPIVIDINQYQKTCLNSYNVNVSFLHQTHVLTIYPQCCGPCNCCRGESYKSAEIIR